MGSSSEDMSLRYRVTWRARSMQTAGRFYRHFKEGDAAAHGYKAVPENVYTVSAAAGAMEGAAGLVAVARLLSVGVSDFDIGGIAARGGVIHTLVQFLIGGFSNFL